MKANINNEDELKLLAYLHEHAKGFGKPYAFKYADFPKALADDHTQFEKNLSFLEQHGLVGVRRAEEMPAVGRFSFKGILDIWLTGTGEDYMRELEAAPGIARKVTVAVVAEMGKTIRDVAVAVLSSHFTKA